MPVQFIAPDETLGNAPGFTPGSVSYLGAPGMGQEQIDLGAQPPVAPQTFGRGVGLGVRDIATAAMLPASMLYDVAYAGPRNLASTVSSAAGGPSFPTPYGGERTAQTLDAFGLPRPQTQGEIIQSGLQTGAAGGMLDPMLSAPAITGLAKTLPPVLRGYAERTGDVLAAQPVRQAVTGGISGGASGTAAAMGLDPALQLGAGVMAGALTGFAPGAAAPGVSAAERDLLDTARTKFGIRIATAQADPLGKYAFSVTKDFPFSGGQKFVEGQHNDLNAAAGKLFGATVDPNGKLTQSAISDASDTLSNGFAAHAASLAGPPDGGLYSDMATLRDRAVRAGDAGKGIVSSIDNMMNVIRGSNTGNIPGNFLAGEINSKSNASLGARSPDPLERQLWSDYRDTLHDFIGRNPNVDQAVYGDLRRQYRNMKVVQGTTNINGDVSPALLANAANRNQRIPGADADLTTLGQIGQRFLKEPPQSGTAPRSMIYDLLLGGAGGLASEGAEQALGKGLPVLGGVAAGSAAQRLMQLGARSPVAPVSYPAYVARAAALTPTQAPWGTPGITAPPPTGTEQMNPYWRALMGQGAPLPPVYGGQ